VIRAIETQYKGYRFRSRLEARWAVFFDALGVEWQYEPQGYALNGGTVHYLPDFYLPLFSGGIYVEVKPKGGDAEKARLLAKEVLRPVLLAFGEPDTRSFECWMPYEAGSSIEITESLVELIDVAFLDKYLTGVNWYEHRLYTWPEASRYDDERDVKRAVYAARSARFEHGESGAARRDRWATE